MKKGYKYAPSATVFGAVGAAGAPELAQKNGQWLEGGPVEMFVKLFRTCREDIVPPEKSGWQSLDESYHCRSLTTFERGKSNPGRVVWRQCQRLKEDGSAYQCRTSAGGGFTWTK